MTQKPLIVDFIVEIPSGSHIKYEFDKELKMLRCDRILHTSMSYPGNYGYIDGTLSNDGDPIDVLMVSDYSILPMTLVKVKIIGVLMMIDEKGQDEKLIAVPASCIDPYYDEVNDITDLPKHLLVKVKHFFEHYKDTEPKKWVKVKDYSGRNVAEKLYNEAKNRVGKLSSIMEEDFEDFEEDFEDFEEELGKSGKALMEKTLMELGLVNF